MTTSAKPQNLGMITLSIMAATIMQVLDTTIANVALPHMQGSLSATQDQISWVLTSYIVAAAIMTPPTGWLANRFGRKRLFAGAVLGFTLTSMLCGAAQSLEQMVLFRLMQGMFGAALVPLSQATLLDAYPREQHGKAMALWGMGVMVGPILGPTLGGWLTENWDWRWVFYINIPFGVLSLVGILTFVPETRPDRSRKLDWFGFAMLSLAIGALQMMLDRGELKDWFSSSEVVVEGLITLAASYFFFAHSATAAQPFLSPAMFRNRNLVTGLCLIFVVGILLLATLALLPPFLQDLKGFPVITTGFALAPRGVGTLISMIIVGRLVGKVDSRILLAVGFGLIALSLGQMAQWNLDVPVSGVVRSGLVQGLGVGFVMPPLTTMAFSTLPSNLRTEAAGMFSLMRNIGSSIGISVVVALLSHNTQVNHSILVESITPFSDIVRSLPPAWNPASPIGLTALNAEITRQAAGIAYLNDFRLMMWMTLAAAPMILLLKPLPKTVKPDPAAVME
jgi:DHA2 family multidrug resistance protein